MSFEGCTKMVQVWRAGRGSLKPLVVNARGEPRMDTDEHGGRKAETEQLSRESRRNWGRPTRSRIADGYSIVKSKVSIRNDFHSSNAGARSNRGGQSHTFRAWREKRGTLRVRGWPPARHSYACQILREFFAYDITGSIRIPDVLNQPVVLEDSQFIFEIGVVLIKVDSVPLLRRGVHPEFT